MARTSFTIRRTPLQVPPVPLEDDDSALKGDDYGGYLAPPPTPLPQSKTSPYADGSTLSVYVRDYDVIDLSWNIARNALATELTSTPQATEILIKYSTLGEPRAASEGAFLASISPGQERWTMSHTGVPEGKWMYYSLFVKYESTTLDPWYERVVSTKAMTPNNYGSTEVLWQSLPEYYRLQDGTDSGSLPPSSSLFGRGPLYRMLSVFGWELDKERTLAHYQMVARDPDLANDEVLDALAYELGLPLSTRDLGTSRLRNIVSNIGYLREFKGTIAGTREWLIALTGSDARVRAIRSNRLSTAASTFAGTLTTTLDPEDIPGANEWVFEGPVSAAPSVGGGVTLTRSGGSGASIVCAKVRATDLSKASQYVTYLDVTARDDAQILGAMLSPTLVGSDYLSIIDGVAVTQDFIDDVDEGRTFVGQLSTGTDDWFQAPISLGVAGDGTFGTATMYLHIFMLFEPGGSLKLNKVSLRDSNRYPYEIDIYSQRVNLIRDPQFSDVVTYWSVTGGVAASAGNKSVAMTLSSTSGQLSTGDGIPILVGTPYYLSVTDKYDNITSCEINSSEYGLITSSDETYSEQQVSDGSKRKTWGLTRRYSAPWLPLELVDCSVTFTASGEAGDLVEISQPLLEALNPDGDYFDGDGLYEGWVPSTSDVSQADYRWGDDGRHASFSYYSSDYQRTKNVVENIIDTLIPVTEVDPVTINFDRVYGYVGDGML